MKFVAGDHLAEIEKSKRSSIKKAKNIRPKICSVKNVYGQKNVGQMNRVSDDSLLALSAFGQMVLSQKKKTISQKIVGQKCLTKEMFGLQSLGDFSQKKNHWPNETRSNECGQ